MASAGSFAVASPSSLYPRPLRVRKTRPAQPNARRRPPRAPSPCPTESPDLTDARSSRYRRAMQDQLPPIRFPELAVAPLKIQPKPVWAALATAARRPAIISRMPSHVPLSIPKTRGRGSGSSQGRPDARCSHVTGVVVADDPFWCPRPGLVGSLASTMSLATTRTNVSSASVTPTADRRGRMAALKPSLESLGSCVKPSKGSPEPAARKFSKRRAFTKLLRLPSRKADIAQRNARSEGNLPRSPLPPGAPFRSTSLETAPTAVESFASSPTLLNSPLRTPSAATTRARRRSPSAATATWRPKLAANGIARSTATGYDERRKGVWPPPNLDISYKDSPASVVRRPHEPPPTTLVIRTFPEFVSLDFDEKEQVRVAIEIEPVACRPARGTYPLRGIDVVVLVDNSFATSDACMERMGRLVLDMAHDVDNGQDRLAVFTTVCTHQTGEEATACQLHALACPWLALLHERVQSLVCEPRPASRGGNVKDALRSTVRFLAEYHDDDVAVLRHTRTHFVVLSPRPVDCADLVAQHVWLHVHLVNPAVLPLPGADLQALLEGAPERFTSTNVVCYQPLWYRVRQLLLNARAPRPTGSITHVEANIVEDPGCSGRFRNGSQTVASLKLHELHTFWKKSDVDMFATRCEVLDRLFREAERHQQALDEVVGAIQERTPVSLFGVQVRFRSSAFPGTQLSTTKSCTLDKMTRRSPSPREPSMEYWRRMVFWIATRASRRALVDQLDRLARQHAQHAGVADLVRCVRTELAHQHAVAALEQHAPAAPAAAPDADGPPPCPGRSSASEPDAAQGIWRRYRQLSGQHQAARRVTQHPLDADTGTLEADAQAQLWRRTALHNKRSIGLDSLHDMSVEMREIMSRGAAGEEEGGCLSGGEEAGDVNG